MALKTALKHIIMASRAIREMSSVFCVTKKVLLPQRYKVQIFVIMSEMNPFMDQSMSAHISENIHNYIIFIMCM